MEWVLVVKPLAWLTFSSLTQTFPSSSSPEAGASTLQQRLQALSTLHNQTSAELVEKESEYNAVYARLTQLSVDSQHTNRELSKQLTEMRNEARWAKEALALAERKEVLARQEIDSLRSASDVSVRGSRLAVPGVSIKTLDLEADPRVQ